MATIVTLKFFIFVSIFVLFLASSFYFISLTPIEIADAQYGVGRDPTPDPDELDNWAWGNMVVGWISFNCLNEALCGVADFSVNMESINLPPTVSNLSVAFVSTSGPSCISSERLDWDFSDPEGIGQNDFQVQVATDSGFVSIFYDSGKLPSPTTEHSPIIGGGADLAFNTNYYWRVQAWDSQDESSGWVVWGAPTTFRTSLHAYPQPDFSWVPPNPSKDETVSFTDETIFFTDIINQAWDWTIPSMPDAEFVDGTNNTTQDSHVQFHTEGTAIAVTLTAIDLELFGDSNSGDGRCDITDDQAVPPGLGVRQPLPEFREVEPLSFWNKLLNAVVGIFS